jgi:drug/metabolite transporter (DMT)-like permease
VAGVPEPGGDPRPRVAGARRPGPGEDPAASLTGYGLAALAATSWGAQSIVAKLLLVSGLPPAALVSTRTALATLIVVTLVMLTRPHLLRVAPRDAARLAVLGVLGMSLANYAYYVALTKIPVAMAALLIYMAPLFVLAAGALVLGERLRRTDVLGAAVTLGGAALLVRAYEPSALRLNAVGLTLGTVTAVSFAFFNLWAKRLPPGLAPWTVMTYSLAASTLFWVVLAPPWTILLRPQRPAVWLGIAVVTVFGTVLPFALYLAALRRISAAHASVTSTLEPVVSGLVAFAVLGEALAVPQLAGGVLVLVGVASLHLRRSGIGDDRSRT